MSKSPSMTLNKKQKDAMMFALMTQAIKKHKDPIIKASVALKQLWKEQLIISAEKTYPFLKKEHWAPLLRTHAANSASCGEVYTLDAKTKPKERDSYSSNKVGYNHIRCVTKEEKEGYALVEAVIKQNWSGLTFSINGPSVPVSQYADSYTFYMPLNFADVIRTNLAAIQLSKYETGQLTDPAEIDWVQRVKPLVERTNDLAAKLKQVSVELFEYYQLLCQVMASIRTLNQLEEQFPEAVKFCPDKPVKVNQMVATEQLAAARAILSKGIPTEKE